MKRVKVVMLCLAWAGSAHGAQLTQFAAVTQAPSVINKPGTSNEYPWFSNDGRLMIWTREDPAGAHQWLWVGYIRNWDALSNDSGGALPALAFGKIDELHAVNEAIKDRELNEQIKAEAYCSRHNFPTLGTYNYIYKFTLFLSVGVPSKTKRMWKASDVWVYVNKGSGDIVNVELRGGISQVIPDTGKNETEPMVTRDGKYLFWASSAFNRKTAKYIHRATACAQANHTAKTYDNLPASRFAWKDQYVVGVGEQAYENTSDTNYHTIVERPGNGPTALVFSGCDGRVKCPKAPMPPQIGNRSCECIAQAKKLSTTGFSAGGKPHLIATAYAGASSVHGGGRNTHPAISGPRHSLSSRGWSLFFMRGKKIYYTKIREQ